jgi:uncharacterized protein YhfF
MEDVMIRSEIIDVFWQRYLAAFPPGSMPSHATYEPWQFGDREALANDLAERIKTGIKTTTSSLLLRSNSGLHHSTDRGSDQTV